MRHRFNFSRALFIAALLLCGSVPAAPAEQFHNALSLQGFTGVLNTPNAYVTDEGKFYALYSNQEESQWRKKLHFQDNYMLSIGLFSLTEIGGRFFTSTGAGGDLSFNGKIRIPFIPSDSYLPQLAVGVQDISGGKNANKLKTWYGVASKDLWRFRFSAGYGTGPDRMDGLFGGVELKTCDWLYLLVDYDTRETNVGARLVTPHIFGYPLNIQLTAKTSLDYKPGTFEVGVGLQMPLGFEHNSTAPIAVQVVAPERRADSAAPLVPTTVLPGSDQQTNPAESAASILPQGDVSRFALQRLQKKLREDGFQNLAVGVKDNSILVVEFENSRYYQNEIDGFGVVAGTVVKLMPDKIAEVRLISKKKNIRMLQFTAPAEDLLNFYRDAATVDKFSSSLKISEDIAADTGVVYVEGDSGPSALHSSLMLYPGLKTYLGTEIGAFDYLLSLKPDITLNTWQGGFLDARWDIPLLWSENFDNGKQFRGERKNTQLERVMLFQAIKPAPGVMAMLGAGMIVHDTYGMLSEALWLPGSGEHRFRVMQAYAEDSYHNKIDSYLGEYRYYYAPLETYLTGTAGKFWSQDTGFMLELKRFFGDTALTAYYKNSEAVDNKNHQAVGIQFSLPLTFRQEMKPYPLQVRGSEEWSYAQESEIAKKGSYNFIGTTTGIKPETTFNLGRIFYNRDRLSEGYFRKHLLRMRDAYIEYGGE